MNPLAVLGRAASLFAGMVAAEWQAAAATFPHWPDGESPIVDSPNAAEVYGVMPQPPLMDWERELLSPPLRSVAESSVVSAESESGVDLSAEPPHVGSALPQPGVGHPTYPVIDPGELRDAATALRCYRASAYPPRRIVDGVLALSHRLDEYADALTAFDNAQQ